LYDDWFSPKMGAAIQFTTGAIEVGLGYTAVTGGGAATGASMGTSTPVSVPVMVLGSIGIAHGFDQMDAARRTWNADSVQRTRTEQWVTTLTGSETAGRTVDLVAGLGSSAAVVRQLGPEAVRTQIVHASCEVQGGIQANKLAGDAMRDVIAAREAPALTEQIFTTVGGAHRVDVLKIGDELVSIESKVGRTSLSQDVRQELARDWWLRRQGQVQRVVWEFSPSEVTGVGGPTAPLRQMLQKLEFEVRINP
jgi:hypothetical protein